MTKYEYMKQMSIEEVVEFLRGNGRCSCCAFDKNGKCFINNANCKSGIRQWLEQEVEE